MVDLGECLDSLGVGVGVDVTDRVRVRVRVRVTARCLDACQSCKLELWWLFVG